MRMGRAGVRQPRGHEAAELEGAGEVESEREKQGGEERDEHRRLQLETPADRRPSRLQCDEQPCQRQESRQHAGAVEQAVRAHLARILA